MLGILFPTGFHHLWSFLVAGPSPLPATSYSLPWLQSSPGDSQVRHRPDLSWIIRSTYLTLLECLSDPETHHILDWTYYFSSRICYSSNSLSSLMSMASHSSSSQKSRHWHLHSLSQHSSRSMQSKCRLSPLASLHFHCSGSILNHPHPAPIQLARASNGPTLASPNQLPIQDPEVTF